MVFHQYTSSFYFTTEPNLLEHLELDYSIKLLTTAHSALKQTGFFIAQVPNAFSPFTPNFHLDVTHLRAYSPASFTQMSRMAGFDGGKYFSVLPLSLSKWRNRFTAFLWKGILTPMLAIYFSATLCSRLGKIYTPNLLAIVHK